MNIRHAIMMIRSYYVKDYEHFQQGEGLQRSAGEKHTRIHSLRTSDSFQVVNSPLELPYGLS